MFGLSMINATTLLCFVVKGTLCAPLELVIIDLCTINAPILL